MIIKTEVAKICGLMLICLAGTVAAGHAQIVLEPKKAPAEAEKLEFLIGTWNNVAEFYDREGKVRGTFNSLRDLGVNLTTKPIMNGLFLESGAGSDVARSWYFYNDVEKKYYWVAIDFRQNFDVLAGDFIDGKLVLTEVAPKKFARGGTIMWRRTYYNIRKDSHEILLEYSRDEGKTWTLSNRQKNTLVKNKG